MVTMDTYQFGQRFDKLIIDVSSPLAGEYEQCTFSHCNFHKARLDKCRFVDCTFEHCDLSLAVTDGAALNNVQFVNCKLTGVRFDQCSMFSFSPSFNGCILDNATFYGVKLHQAQFDGCRMHEVDFSEADMTKARFKECDMANAVFHRTLLTGADFTDAINYNVDPTNNKLKGARFSQEGLPGLLSVFEIIIT